MLKANLNKIQELKENAAVADDYEKAADYKVEECKILNHIKALEEKMGTLDVTTEDIAEVVESWTGIPVQRVTETEAINC